MSINMKIGRYMYRNVYTNIYMNMYKEESESNSTFLILIICGMKLSVY
jgi:hypothetical protein